MSENTELMVRDASVSMPALGVEQAVQRYQQLAQFIASVLKENLDYGKVPGSSKNVLLKPGAEKLGMFFGLNARFTIDSSIEDWTGAEHGGEPLFHYQFRCTLTRGGAFMGEGVGSCNSRESKYRYRSAERKCPECGKETIKKSKFPPRDRPNAAPGWYCFAKIGGCGATFDAGDPDIEDQQAGKVLNPDICDLVNTISKMAQKRSLIAAILVTVNASDYFTQDLEDMQYGDTIDGTATVIPSQPEPQQKQAEQRPPTANSKAPAPTAGIPNADAPALKEQIMQMHALAKTIYTTPAELAKFKSVTYAAYGVDSTTKLTRAQVQEVIAELHAEIKQMAEDKATARRPSFPEESAAAEEAFAESGETHMEGGF
jgi:hypothetical protein